MSITYFLFVIAIIAGLVLLLIRKRRSPKGDDNSLTKKEISSPHAFELNNFHENPAFLADNDFGDDGVGASAINLTYESGTNTVNPTYESGFPAPVQSGGRENPMYSGHHEDADKEVKNEDEVEPNHGQDGATTFGNPLYESFHGDNQRPKDMKLVLNDEVVVDEDV